MIHALKICAFSLCFAVGTVAIAGPDEGVFRAMTLDQARKSASEGQKKFVLIDFYTVWCGPCKKLDETTWKDQQVRDWLAKEGVCLKVDAEKDEVLADKYRVNSYPTLLLLRPDGTEIDRLVGYRDAKTFLTDAGEALAGNDILSRARKQLEGPKANDPMLRMDYARALEQKGRAEDALSEYLWCFDHGLEHSESFVGVRISFLLNNIVQLARSAPTALDELRKRRDSAAKAIEAGKADFPTAMGFTALNGYLNESDRTLATFDKIKGDKAQPTQVVEYLFDQSLDMLLKAKRYQEIVEKGDSKAKVRQLVADYEMFKPFFPDDASLRDYMKQQVSLNGSKYYEAVLGAGDKPKAAEVAAVLIEFDSVNAYPPLIAAAKRAGDASTADQLTESSRKPAQGERKP